jgi:hypothetical protein
LNIAVERINNSQAAYRVAQDNYTKACDKAAKVASELARIKANLKSLTEKNLTMVSEPLLSFFFQILSLVYATLRPTSRKFSFSVSAPSFR